MQDPVQAIVFFFAFIFSVTCHEAAHAWAAKRGGDLTAYHAGQVSLDPTPHMRREPIGMLALPLITLVLWGWPFGYASAPYDPNWARTHPRRAGWMALAGPSANLVLALVCGLAIRIGAGQGIFTAPDVANFAQVATSAGPSELAGAGALILGIFFSMNLLLFVLNLLPIPPLDGSGVVLLLLSPRLAYRWQEWSTQPMVGWIGILIMFNTIGEIFRPIFFFSLELLYPGVRYD